MRPLAKRRLFFESLEQRQLLSASVNTWEPPVVLGENLIFVASDAEHGTEIWKSDGTESGTILLKDIRSGTNGSAPSQLTVCGKYVYFTANNGTSGIELWRTDGTSSGTIIVKDIYAGATGSDADKLTTVGNTLYFIADNGSSGTELWKSDGTSAGTVMVKDIWSGVNPSCGWSSELAAVGNTLYFSAQTAEGNYELWKSDGTSNGTTFVKEIRSGNVGSYPANLTAVGNTLYFTADDSNIGTELWKSDGTSAGTVLVRDVCSGATGSIPAELIAVGSTLYFTANNSTNGTELWKSNGTSSGTVMVRDIYANASSSTPTELVAMGSTVYFAATNGTNGVELWKSDGTSNGTVMVKDIRSSTNSSNPLQLTVVGNTLYFAANDGTNGIELWKSDGTANGTVMVKDIRSGTNGSNPFHLTAFNGQIFFAATDDFASNQLFHSDGTANGTSRVVKPVVTDATVTLGMPKTGTAANQWTVRRNGSSLEIVNAVNTVVFTQSLLTFNRLVINASGIFDDKLTIDFASGGGFSLSKGVAFVGSTAKTETLTFIGSSSDDKLRLNFGNTSIWEGGLGISARDVETLSFNGGAGSDAIDVIGPEYSSVYNASNNFFSMSGGGHQLEISNFNRINAFADGTRDKAYVYAQNNALIFMNDQYAECRGNNQSYRIWRSEQVVAYSSDATNNTVIHSGSRAFDYYAMAQGYGFATNAIGSYSHEFIGFKNVIISTPFLSPSISLPTTNGWTTQSDRGTWTQNGYNVTIMGQVTPAFRDGFAASKTTSQLSAAFSLEPVALDESTQAASFPAIIETTLRQAEATSLSVNADSFSKEDETLIALFADEQARLHRKKDGYFSQADETDDWLEDFEKFVLLELRK